MALTPDQVRRRRRRRVIILLSIPAALLALWIAIHRVPGLGPFLADTARAVIGADAVAKLEDYAYAVEDRWNRLWRSGEKPVAYWDVPSGSAAAPPPPPPDADAGAPGPPAFRPADVAPIYPKWAAPGDGTWVAIPDPRRPADPAYMHKTLLHPDAERAWAAVAIVAVDLGAIDLHLVAGSQEPKSSEPEAAGYKRPALIAAEHHGTVLAAFNGGYKSTHGGFGMRIDGVTLARPKPGVCTVALYDDGRIAIRNWNFLAETEPSMRWWRQTPGCMYELGKMHGGLTVDGNTYWGATLDRDTVIRRSAIALSEDGKVLYVGIGDATEARAIARAMNHVGGHNVAQLDVNWSYPKFLFMEPRGPGSAELYAKPLMKGFDYTEDDYIRERAPRDFFYLTRKAPAPPTPPAPPPAP